MKKRRLISLLLALTLVFALAAGCTKKETPVSEAPSAAPSESASPAPDMRARVSLGLLKGPTGMGAAKLLSDNDMNETKNVYDVTIAAEPTEIVSAVAAGTVDIAAVPTNLAATLFKKTDRGVEMLALNTLGVLYILENGDTVQSVADLRGQTVYATGQGANPEHVLNHVLRAAGLEPGTDVTVEFRESAELVTLMVKGEAKLAMLPVPAATTVLMKNADVRAALDMTAAWDAVTEGSTLVMGCVIVRRAFAEENPQAVADFLAEYGASIEFVKGDTEKAAAMIAQYEITASAEIAAAAIPQSNLVFITGTDMRETVRGYYEALYQADPASIGGSIPDDAFYYGA